MNMNEDGIEGALRHVTELAQSAHEPSVTVCPQLERVFVAHNGEMTSHEIAPPRKLIELHGLRDIIAIAVQHKGSSPEVYHEGVDDHFAPESGAVFDGGAVRVIMNSETRLDRAKMQLRPSQLFMRVLHMHYSPKTMNVDEAVRLLRFELPVAGVDALATSLRKITFKTTAEVEQGASHGSSTFGERLERLVSNAAEVPESMEISIPVYANDHEIRELSTVKLKLGVFLDMERKGIQIMPLADEIDLANAEVQARIGEHLVSEIVKSGAADSVSVFHGSPSGANFMNPDARLR